MRGSYRFASRLRLAAALVVLALFLFAFTGPRGAADGLLAPLARAQLSPALIRDGLFSGAAIAAITAALVFGRLYCSVLCPMGTIQELFWRLARRRSRRVEPWRLRVLVPVLAGVGLALGLTPLFTVLDPFSNFGRGVAGAASLLRGGAALSAPLLASLAIFSFILLLSILRGRRFCDWCPVGGALGVCASAAPFGMRIDHGACVSCGACERACPSNCADAEKKAVSLGRCVLCVRCAAACPEGAVRYGLSRPGGKTASERRGFLAGSGRFALGAAAAAVYFGSGSVNHFFRASGTRGGVHSEGKEPPILPPGALDARLSASACLHCQACVTACPAGIVRFKDAPYPELDYDAGYCQYNCTACGDVCPTGAIRPLGSQKQRTRVALSSLLLERCLVAEKKQACGACAEVCPTHAIHMPSYEEAGGLPEPIFDEAYCIGCGACYYACPVQDEPRVFKLKGITPQETTPGLRPAEEGGEAQKTLPGMEADFPF